jgi:hypothetical protein
LMCREAAFLPAHIETTGFQIEILQAQINEFRDRTDCEFCNRA